MNFLTLEVKEVEVCDFYQLVVTFDNDEQRLFDGEELFEMPAFQILKDYKKFKTARVENGVVVWLDGELDISPAFLYKRGEVYDTSDLIGAEDFVTV